MMWLRRLGCSHKQNKNKEPHVEALLIKMDSLRLRIVDAVCHGERVCAVAATFRVVRSTVRRIMIEWRETGCVKNLPKLGRPRSVTTGEFKTIVEGEFEDKPVTSVHELARDMGASDYSVRKAVKALGFKSRIVPKVPLLTKATKLKCVSCCKKIVNSMKEGRNKDKRILFSNEKFFQVDGVTNRRYTQ